MRHHEIGLVITFRRAGEVPIVRHVMDGTLALTALREILAALDVLVPGDRVEITPEPDELGGPEVSRSSHYS
jgi:hypothetical protein